MPSGRKDRPRVTPKVAMLGMIAGKRSGGTLKNRHSSWSQATFSKSSSNWSET